MTLIDTASAYGIEHNEVLVGRATADRRDEVRLATKVGIDLTTGRGKVVIRNDPDYIKAAASLLRLGTDHIDLYYLHRVNPQVPLSDSVGALAELVQEGKVRHIGLSEVTGEQLHAAYAIHPIAAVQSEYSLWTRDPETAVADAARELSVGLVAYSPLGRGFLTGTVDTAALDLQLTADDLAALDPLAAQVVGARDWVGVRAAGAVPAGAAGPRGPPGGAAGPGRGGGPAGRGGHRRSGAGRGGGPVVLGRDVHGQLHQPRDGPVVHRPGRSDRAVGYPVRRPWRHLLRRRGRRQGDRRGCPSARRRCSGSMSAERFTSALAGSTAAVAGPPMSLRPARGGRSPAVAAAGARREPILSHVRQQVLPTLGSPG